MIKPNWNIFKAKFSENPQNNFEWFCYLLFCKEFNKKVGIFRYFNHSGMETNPIEVENDWIAWESKFYEDKLSSNKAEFIRKLNIIDKKNSEVTKVYFYTPIDWTESSEKDKRKTNEQIEIENHAKGLNIEIYWKGASFFESEFVCIENEIISKHFFTLEKSIFDLMDELQKHSENLLNDIQTCFIQKLIDYSPINSVSLRNVLKQDYLEFY